MSAKNRPRQSDHSGSACPIERVPMRYSCCSLFLDVLVLAQNGWELGVGLSTFRLIQDRCDNVMRCFASFFGARSSLKCDREVWILCSDGRRPGT